MHSNKMVYGKNVEYNSILFRNLLKVPIQPVLLVDTVERMHFNSILTLTPGISRVVYLETIQVESYSLDQVEELKEKVYNLMDQGLRRYRNYPPA